MAERGAAAATTGPDPDAVVRSVARLLLVGTVLVVILVALGTILAVAQGERPLGPQPPAFDPAGLPGGLLALRPEALLWSGLVLTVALPSARVLLALVGFARQGDRRAALVALGILFVLALSVGLALITR